MKKPHVSRRGRYTVETHDGRFITVANADTLPEARRKALDFLLRDRNDKDLQFRGLGIHWNDEELPLIGVVRLWNGKGIWYPFSTKKHPYILRKDGKLGDMFPEEYRW